MFEFYDIIDTVNININSKRYATYNFSYMLAFSNINFVYHGVSFVYIETNDSVLCHYCHYIYDLRLKLGFNISIH